MTADSIKLGIFAPDRERCGISDYVRQLNQEIGQLDGLSIIRTMSPPHGNSKDDERRLLATQYKSAAQDVSGPPVDLVHVHHEYSLFGGIAPHRSRSRAFFSGLSTPAVMTVHEIAQDQRSPVRQRLIELANRLSLVHRQVRVYVVHTETDRHRLIRLGVADKDIRLIRLATPDPEPLPPSHEAHERIGAYGRRVITLFGFLAAKKGHYDAITALSMLPEDVLLVFAGDIHPSDGSGYVRALREYIRASPLRDRIRITGFLSADDLIWHLAATDVAIAPYHASSGSASVARLMSAGLPVVATSIPVFEDILKSEPGSILLTNQRNALDLASKITMVLADAELRGSLIEHSLLFARANSFNSVARSMRTIYSEALNK